METIGMSGRQSEITVAVAYKLKRYLETQRKEQDVSHVNLKACCKKYRNYEKDELKSKAQLLASEVRRMQSMKQLTDRELAAKRKLEIQMACGNNPFILSPYACPVVDGEKRIPKFTKKKVPNKRILSVNRIQSASRGNRQTGNSPTKAERERILNLTAKLLVATETVALPKNRHQSRESQTSTEEHFPSLPAVPRIKSSYSDPGVHTLTKEHVEKLNGSESGNKQLKDEFSSVDGGSLKNQRTPFRVENCNRGYVVRKKPASYPSSVASQNSQRFVSPGVRALSNNFTVIKDKNEDFESFDDDYFDRDFPEVNQTQDWLEGTGEKERADTSTQTIENRGTQTQKELSELELIDGYTRDNRLSHLHTDVQQFDGFSDNSASEVADRLDGGRIMSIKTQTDFKPRVITYQVYVITGDVAGASTTSDIKINIFGELGDSGDRCLLKSKTSKVPFQRGQTDVFDLDCKYLGKLSNIRIGHNGMTADDGWYFEKVYIKAGQKAKKAYTFTCKKWLSAKEGDGQIVRDVTLTQAIPVNELPPILPRKTMHCKASSEESEMSEALRPKFHKSKATRDKINKDKSRDKKKPVKYVIKSSSSESPSPSSTDSEIDKRKKTYQKKKRSGKHSQYKTKYDHEIPKANMSGMVENLTNKTNNIELDISTDTSITSCITSPYRNRLYDAKATAMKSSKSVSKRSTDMTLDAINTLTSTRDTLSDVPSPKTHTKISSDSDKALRKIDKKQTKTKTKTKKVASSSDDKSKKLVTESPLHYKDISVTESVIIPQEAVMLGTNENTIHMSPLKSEASSLDSSEEMKTNIDGDTEEENVEFSLKDTKKQSTDSPNEDDLYMAGFRAGITANKDKRKDKDLEEKEAFHEKVKNGPTIHEACEDGDLERLKELITSVPELKNKVDERGWAPIHISAAFGHLDMLKWLTISGVNLSEETHTGYTAIHLAAMNGHVNCIMILSAMGCSISSCTVDQFTPLHLAAMSGHIECVKWLLSNRAKIDAKDANDRTPLDLAEQFQHKDCEKLLRIFGKELKRKDSVMTLLRDPNALRKNSSDLGSDHAIHEDSDDSNKHEEDKGWISDAEDVSDVVGRGGDERPESQRRMSMQSGRKGSVVTKTLPPRPGPPKSTARRMSKQEERQVLQLEEKKRNYEVHKKKVERRNSSFLESIRQEIDGVEEPDIL